MQRTAAAPLSEATLADSRLWLGVGLTGRVPVKLRIPGLNLDAPTPDRVEAAGRQQRLHGEDRPGVRADQRTWQCAQLRGIAE